jgi:hypothetical protein
MLRILFNFPQILIFFVSFLKSYKLNLRYFKNKKSNFISAAANFSQTNKIRAQTNPLIKPFNLKINSKMLLVYFFNTIITVLFICFKKNVILTYFIDVLPFELKLNIPAINSSFLKFLNLFYFFNEF